mgnify:FL=1
MQEGNGTVLGFSTLSLFFESSYRWAEVALKDRFNAIEILCEGPMWPRHALENADLDNITDERISFFLHSPTVDLNPASINRGIREETQKQLKESVDMASMLGARYVTTHPGIVHRPVPGIIEMCREWAIEVLGEASDYARSHGVNLSIENMPNKQTYLCRNPDELELFRKSCNCGVTIDTGHANTWTEPPEFFRMDQISYLHVNDNNGMRDQHLCPGDGCLDLSLLTFGHSMIIELDNYDNVLRARDVILQTISSDR